MRTAFRHLPASAAILTLVALTTLSRGATAAEAVHRDPALTPYRHVARGDLIQLEQGPGEGLGGELVVYGVSGTIRDGLAWPSLQDVPRFNTFSIERGEPLYFGVSYRVARISREARPGGLGGKNIEDRQSGRGSDPIDPRTAYLYEQFYFHRLSPYAYDDYVSSGDSHASPRGLRNTHAEELQRAIWFLENELEACDPASGQSLGYQYDPTDMNIARATLGAESLAYRWVVEADAAVRDRNNTIGQRVRVLTLVDEKGGPIQDVLMVLPYDPVPPLREFGDVAPPAMDTPFGGIFASAYTASFSHRGWSDQPSEPGTPTTSSGSGGDPSPKPGPKKPVPGPLPVPTPEPSSLLIWGVVAAAAAAWTRKRSRAGI
jgi:hypothetical protein